MRLVTQQPNQTPCCRLRWTVKHSGLAERKLVLLALVAGRFTHHGWLRGWLGGDQANIRSTKAWAVYRRHWYHIFERRYYVTGSI